MTDFNPGPGWRRLDPHEETHRPQRRTLTEHDADGSFVALWVREEPVPPLPTEPYTVIRVTWNEGTPPIGRELWLTRHGTWNDDDGVWQYPAWLMDHIASFEVLAEPRAVTAKALLDYIRDTVGDDYFNTVISEKFGVES